MDPAYCPRMLFCIGCHPPDRSGSPMKTPVYFFANGQGDLGKALGHVAKKDRGKWAKADSRKWGQINT